MLWYCLCPVLINSQVILLSNSCRGYFIEYEEGMIDRPVKSEREWSNYRFHYDNVFNALLTLFTVQTFEGWPGYACYKTCFYSDIVPMFHPSTWLEVAVTI